MNCDAITTFLCLDKSNNGEYCEMPLGVKRLAYRLTDPETRPLCYGCHGINNGDCCVDQHDEKTYSHLQSPDYAFELDSFERKSSGM